MKAEIRELREYREVRKSLGLKSYEYIDEEGEVVQTVSHTLGYILDPTKLGAGPAATASLARVQALVKKQMTFR